MFWFRSLTGRQNVPFRAAPDRLRGRQPRLEQLDDRIVPAAYVVNAPGDAGTGAGLAGDIRYAVTQANADPASTITFDPAAGAVITLSHGELAIGVDMTITGTGALSISGSSGATSSRVFHVTSPTATVTISSLTITGGTGSPTPSAVRGNQGGDIFNSGKLTLLSAGVTAGSIVGTAGIPGLNGGPGGTASGGGIFNADGATLVLDGTAVTGNAAFGGDGGTPSGGNGGDGGAAFGGGLFNAPTAAVTVRNGSSFGTNLVRGGAGTAGTAGTASSLGGGAGGVGGPGSGGGIFSAGKGGLSIAATTFSLNGASGGAGGAGGTGLPNATAGGAGGAGGGGGAAGAASGGAITNTAGSLAITGSTFTNNSASSGFGDGGAGEAGTAGNADQNGGAGGVGGSGGVSGSATGGAVSVTVTAGDTSVTGGSFTGNFAAGGSGGGGGLGADGGAPGLGGAPGAGGTGGSGANGRSVNAFGGGVAVSAGKLTLSDTQFQENAALGGSGGVGAAGGVGGGGGSGGAGGTGWGGGVFLGDATAGLTATDATFTNNRSLGGTSGGGGRGGDGLATGGSGGTGGSSNSSGSGWGGGVSYMTTATHAAVNALSFTGGSFVGNVAVGGQAGRGGDGGAAVAGSGGNGGIGFSGSSGWGGGVSVYERGGAGPSTLALTNTPVTGNVVRGGSGFQGGAGGSGTAGGGSGGRGGTGGSAWGGGIQLRRVLSYSLTNSPVTGNQLFGGTGAAAGAGGGATATGNGGSGGSGGSGGETWGGGIVAQGLQNYGALVSTSVIASSPVTGNTSLGGSGGVGGAGGTATLLGTGGAGGVGGTANSLWGGGIHQDTRSTSSSLTVTDSPVGSNLMTGGVAGDGGAGGSGGTGGTGGTGGRAYSSWGGGISLSGGDLALANSPVTRNTSVGTTAGRGGAGGSGTAGNGGTGGSGGQAYSSWGGGISSYSSNSNIALANSDVSFNTLTAAVQGAGGKGGDGTANGGAGGAGGGGSSTAYGGGIGVFRAAKLTITNSALVGNVVTGSAGGNGGGGGNGGTGPGGAGGVGADGRDALGGSLYLSGGKGDSLTNVTIADSTATAGRAGQGGAAGTGVGAASGGAAGTAGRAAGGGLYVNRTPLTVTNVTVTNNALVAGAGGTGGLATNGGTDGTPSVAGPAVGGGYFAGSFSGGAFVATLDLQTVGNSILALNTATTDPDVFGTFTSAGHNLISNVGSATGYTAAGDLTAVTAAQLNLGPAQNNGGPTSTVALLPGSIAIDAGDDALLGTLTTDQRGTGFARVVNAASDIGAFEVQNTVATTTGLTTSGSPSNVGVAVTLTATVTPAGVGTSPLQGTVTFFNGATQLGSPVALANGVATLVTTTLPPGPNSITATYNGFSQGSAPVYAPSTSPAVPRQVNVPTATAVTSSLNPSLFSQSVTFTATVSSVAGTPTGAVTFTIDGVDTAPMMLTGGVATTTTATLSAGPHTVTATYAGSGNFLASTGATVTQRVTAAATSTALASSVNPSLFGQSVTFTATVSSAAGTPGGAVTFTIDGVDTAPTALAGGVAADTTASLSAGPHTVTVTYAAAGNFAASTSAAVNQQVNAITTTSVTTSGTPSTFGQSVTFTATVLSVAGTPTGAVTFAIDGTPVATVTLSGGTASYATAALSARPHTVTVTYAGAGNFLASSSGGLAQQVTADRTTTALASSLNPSVFGQTVTLTATVSGSFGTPTGAVTFTIDAVAAAPVPLSGGGVAAFATAGLSAGPHTVTATYFGTLNFATSVSPALTQRVALAATVTTVATSGSPSVAGQSVTFTATVAGGTPGVAVAFTLDGAASPFATAALDGTGRAAVTTAAIPAGSHTVTAAYAGDATTAPSSGDATQSVTPVVVPPSTQPPAITVGSFPTAATVRTPFSLTVTASGLPAPTFTVVSGRLPAGLTLDPVTGAVTGTPTQAGAYTGVIRATNSTGSADLPFSIFAASKPAGQATATKFAVSGNPTAALLNSDGSGAGTGATPFGPGVTTRVVLADVTGDGVPDAVYASGPGVRARVVVIDGLTGKVAFDWLPFEPSYTGGALVAAGDVDGDGRADVAVTADLTGGARVVVYSGRTGGILADFFGIEDPAFRGGARVTLGDVTGDGLADLVVAAGFGGGPRVAAFDGATLRPGQTPARLVADFFAFESTLRDGAFVSVGDINGDGIGDLVFGGGPTGGPRVMVADGVALLASNGLTLTPLANFFAGDPAGRSGVSVAVKTLDGDTRADLVVDYPTPAGARVVSYLGSSLAPAGTPPVARDFGTLDPLGVYVG